MGMNPRRAFTALLLLAALAASSAHAYDPQSLVIARPGTMPVILTVPHDGVEDVPGMSRRSRGVTVRDTNARLLAEGAADYIQAKTGRRPYVLVALFSRRYIDANRSEREGVESPEGLPAYRAYHAHLAAFITEVHKRFPGGAVLLDVHGQASDASTVYRGTRNRLSVKALLARHGEAALSGENSIMGQFKALGHDIEPARPGEREVKYQGANTLDQYGSHQPGGIDAIQLEFGKNQRDDPGAAEDFGKAIMAFEKAYLAAPK